MLAQPAAPRYRLRPGDGYVAQSYRYADLHRYLIPPAKWEQVRPELCERVFSG